MAIEVILKDPRFWAGVIAFIGVISGSLLSYNLSRRAAKKEAKTEMRAKLYEKLIVFVSSGQAPYDREEAAKLMKKMLLYTRGDILTLFLKILNPESSDQTPEQNQQQLIRHLREQLKVDVKTWSRPKWPKTIKEKQNLAVKNALEWLKENDPERKA